MSALDAGTWGSALPRWPWHPAPTHVGPGLLLGCLGHGPTAEAWKQVRKGWRVSLERHHLHPRTKGCTLDEKTHPEV